MNEITRKYNFYFVGKKKLFCRREKKLSPLIILFLFFPAHNYCNFSINFDNFDKISLDLPAVEFLETLNYTIFISIFTRNLVFPWITGVVHFFFTIQDNFTILLLTFFEESSVSLGVFDGIAHESSFMGNLSTVPGLSGLELAVAFLDRCKGW